MTTKQEIIDYVKKQILIRHANLDEAVSACDEFEKMIKDLKPTVKPLLWHKHPKGLDQWVSNIGYFVIEEFNSGFNIFWDDEEMPEANSLEKAQAYCQSCHDMEILGMIEYE